MTAARRLAAYGLALAVVFGAGAGLGALVYPSSADDGAGEHQLVDAVEPPAPAPHSGTVGHGND